MAIFRRSLAGFLFSFSIICSAFYPISGGGAVHVSFPPTLDIHLWKDASIYNDEIQLTQSSGNGTWRFGWSTYATTIPFCDSASRARASFYNHFQFSITRFVDHDNADGLAFFIARPDFRPSNTDAGYNLGLFRSETDGMPSNQIFAVEVDTYKNKEYDPDNNHVGFNLNSVKSKITFSVSGLYEGAALNNGKVWYAWVDYNSSNAAPELQLFLAQNPDGTTPSKPERPVLIYPVDLCEYLPQNVTVGFSASTGVAYEIHTLHYWNFNSSQNSSQNSSPNSSSNSSQNSSPNSSQNSSPNSSPNSWDTSTSTGKKKKHSTLIAFVASFVGALLVFLVSWVTNYMCTGRLCFQFHCNEWCNCCNRY